MTSIKSHKRGNKKCVPPLSSSIKFSAYFGQHGGWREAATEMMGCFNSSNKIQ